MRLSSKSYKKLVPSEVTTDTGLISWKESQIQLFPVQGIKFLYNLGAGPVLGFPIEWKYRKSMK